MASDLADLKALIHVSSSEYCERTVDVMLSEGQYQRHLNRLRGRLETNMRELWARPICRRSRVTRT